MREDGEGNAENKSSAGRRSDFGNAPSLHRPSSSPIVTLSPNSLEYATIHKYSPEKVKQTLLNRNLDAVNIFDGFFDVLRKSCERKSPWMIIVHDEAACWREMQRLPVEKTHFIKCGSPRQVAEVATTCVGDSGSRGSTGTKMRRKIGLSIRAR